jgi:hypothetical protein
MQAADALCPRAAQLYRQGGSALRQAVLADLGNWGKLVQLTRGPMGEDATWRAERWLSKQVLAALSERPDLQLTGTNPALGIQAPRVKLRRDFLLQAVRPQDANDRYAISVDLRFSAEAARFVTQFVGYYDPEVHAQDPAIPEPVELIAVRIEAADDLRAGAGTRTRPPAEIVRSDAQPRYTLDECRSWLQRRVADWPDSTPPPSRRKCLEAARAYFADPVPRDAFHAVRREVVPHDWQKPGPRGPQKPT